MKFELDKLMGRDRDLAPEDQKDAHWDDEDQCKFFLCGFCPHELCAMIISTQPKNGSETVFGNILKIWWYL